jgi:hypothetical protein
MLANQKFGEYLLMASISKQVQGHVGGISPGHRHIG